MKIMITVNIQMKSMIHCDNDQIRNPHQFIDVQCTHQVPMTVYGVHETMKARTWMALILSATRLPECERWFSLSDLAVLLRFGRVAQRDNLSVANLGDPG